MKEFYAFHKITELEGLNEDRAGGEYAFQCIL